MFRYFGQFFAIVAALVLYVIASGKEGFDLAAGFASNGYGEHSPGGYSLVACLVTANSCSPPASCLSSWA